MQGMCIDILCRILAQLTGYLQGLAMLPNSTVHLHGESHM